MPSTSTSRLEGLTTSVAVKAPCRLATTAAITASGLLVIDGIQTVAGDRVLRKNETDTTLNGIYIADSGTWERAKDFDGSFDAVNGTTVFVSSGTAYANNYFRLSATNPVIIGTSALSWTALGPSFTGDSLLATSISGLSIPASVNVFETTGYRAVGKGAGLYFRWAAPLTALPAVGVGENAWWFTDALGAKWYPDINTINLYQLGAYADFAFPGLTGTDDYPAFLAYRSFAIWAGKADGSTQYRALPKLILPFGRIYTSDVWDFDFGTVHVIGDGLGAQNGGNQTMIVGAAGIDAVIRTHYVNTSENTTRTPGFGAIGSAFENIQLYTTGAGGGTSAVGWRCRSQTRLINCGAQNFIKAGVDATASAGGGGAVEGNTNLLEIIGGNYTFNGINILLDGDDNNAVIVERLNVNFAGTWGIKGSAFLGGTIGPAHADSCGVAGSGPTYAPNVNGNSCSYGGNRYSVMPDQAVAASTTTPGTNATIWHLIGAGAPHAQYPLWVSGMTWNEGGPYYTDNANAAYVVFVCYSEQIGGPSHFSTSTLVLGGPHYAGTVGGADLRANAGQLYSSTGFKSEAPNAAGSNVTAKLGGAPASNDFLTLTYGALQDWTLHYDATGGNLLWQYQASSALSPFAMTGPSTTSQFGRGVAQPHKFVATEIFLGSGRAITTNTAAPTTGPHAIGEIVWNDGTATTSELFWRCITAGTPGTWQAEYRHLYGSATYNPPSIAAAGTTTTTVTATGAAVGDFARASFSLTMAGLMMSAYVSAADTVTVVLFNPTGGAVDLASGTLRAEVTKQ